MRPIAVVHAQVTSAYFLFLAIPGHVSLDYVVNRMLIHAAKELGADKVVDIKVDITPGDGIWTFRKILGWRSAQASGIAVVMEDAAATPAQPAQPAPIPTK
jgi:predicted metal-dependent phosphoesterase TrpH